MNICEYCEKEIKYDPKGFNSSWVMTKSGLRHIDCFDRIISDATCKALRRLDTMS